MYNGGYAGKILRVNLTDQTTTVEPVSFKLAKQYMGGVGFAFKYLYDELKPGTPPLAKPTS